MERGVVSRKPWSSRARSLFAILGIVAILAGVAVPVVNPATASATKKSEWCQLVNWQVEYTRWNEDWVGYAFWYGQAELTGCG